MPFVHAFAIMAIGLSPVYLFPSGLPQPTDFAFLFAAFLFFLPMLLGKRSKPLVLDNYHKLFAVLVFWIVMVSLVWGVVESSSRIAYNSLFYLYNFLISLFIYNYLSSSSSAQSHVSKAVVLALFISFVGAYLSIGTRARPTGFFNNPNQLAYFSLCAYSAYLILSDFSPKKVVEFFLVTFLAAFPIFLTMSLGALAGFLFLFFSTMIVSFRSLKSFVVVGIFLLLLPLLLLFFDSYLGGVLQSGFDVRISRADDKVEGIYSQRNYDRVMAFPQYWLLGAGEGEFSRFYPFDGHEIHASLANLFFSYGVVALVLFLFMHYVLAAGSPVYAMAPILSLHLYSISHMGLRSTFFWIVLCLISWKYARKKDEFDFSSSHSREA